MNLTDIALNTTLISMLVVTAAALLSNSGYSFDLRAKSGNRRRDPNRLGGRRNSDGRLTT